MIKITKPGKTVFNGKCGKCGCEFTYELEDLWNNFGSGYVKCPECSDKYFHPSQSNKFATKSDDLWSPFVTTGDSISNDMYNCLQGNHEWECCGVSTAGTDYRCRRCGIMKCEPLIQKDYPLVTLTNLEE